MTKRGGTVIRAGLLLLLLACVSADALSQAENVPAHHPVYAFLKRMETKGIIEGYHDAVLPLSRREVAGFLTEAEEKREELTGAYSDYLDEFLSEFQLEVTGSTAGFHRLIDSGEPSLGGAAAEAFSDREKFIYFAADSSANIFINFLMDLEARRITGDDLGSAHSEYLQFGGRVRGTLWGKLGYYAELTNAQFWGSRDLLKRDPLISQSHALGVTNAQNFDFAESYLRFDAEVVSAQIGRERLLWGYGAYEQMTLQDTVRTYDFLRAEASYKKYLRYTFMHAWILGRADQVSFQLPFDSTEVYTENVNADKYFAAHRLELSWPSVLDFGAQEMVIYSNRSPDLAYLNPLAFIEPVQRSRGERDNVFWAFDLQFHMIPNVQLHGSIVYDDIHLTNLFSNRWEDRYAWQAGILYSDPFTIPNVDLMVEYTRVEPYVYSHARSREGSYTSLDRLLGPQIGPNADSWFLRADWVPLRNLWLSASVVFERKGQNELSAEGYLQRNVGGSEWMPHRSTDPVTKEFLDGIRQNTRRIWLSASWEIVNQIWLDLRYQYDEREDLTVGEKSKNQTYFGRLRTVF